MKLLLRLLLILLLLSLLLQVEGRNRGAVEF